MVWKTTSGVGLFSMEYARQSKDVVHSSGDTSFYPTPDAVFVNLLWDETCGEKQRRVITRRCPTLLSTEVAQVVCAIRRSVIGDGATTRHSAWAERAESSRSDQRRSGRIMTPRRGGCQRRS